jgi:Cu+-exporting ATPase
MQTNVLKNIAIAGFTAVVLSACSGEKAERPLPAIEYVTNADATESVASLEIEGMMCEHGCVASIKQKVSALAGVNAVEIDFEEDLATVTFDPAKISEKEIITEIQRINDEQYTVTKATVEQAKANPKASSMNDGKPAKKAKKVFEEVAVEDIQPKIVFPNIFGLFQKFF